MGLLNKTSLPARLLDPKNWVGTDDDNRWMRWRIKRKYWFAFSSLPEKQGLDLSFIFLPLWWISIPILIIPVFKKWRRVPTVIFAIKGKGSWRCESVKGPQVALPELPHAVFPRIETSTMSAMFPFYLSRIQPWCRWHVAVHYPLLVTWHCYKRAEYVLSAGEIEDTDGKVISGYKGWHYDADGIFWGDGAALGNYK